MIRYAFLLLAFLSVSLGNSQDECLTSHDHAFPTYGSDAHLKCWVPETATDGTPIKPGVLCKRISVEALCNTTCAKEYNLDLETGNQVKVWRCQSAAASLDCEQFIEKGDDYGLKVARLVEASPGESGKKMKNSIQIKCIKLGHCGCERKLVDGTYFQQCKKGSDVDNGDLYQGIEGGADCSVPPDDNLPPMDPNDPDFPDVTDGSDGGEGDGDAGDSGCGDGGGGQSGCGYCD